MHIYHSPSSFFLPSCSSPTKKYSTYSFAPNPLKNPRLGSLVLLADRLGEVLEEYLASSVSGEYSNRWSLLVLELCVALGIPLEVFLS